MKKTPRTNSSPKNPAIRPANGVEKPSVLNPKIISKIASNSTRRNTKDQKPKIIFSNSISYFLMNSFICRINEIINRIFKTLLIELDKLILNKRFIIKDIKKVNKIQKIGSFVKKYFLSLIILIIKIMKISKNARLIKKLPKIKVIGNKENNINNSLSFKLILK